MVRLDVGEANLQESQTALDQQQRQLAANQKDIEEREGDSKKREEDFQSLEDSLRVRELNAEAGFVAERRASLQLLEAGSRCCSGGTFLGARIDHGRTYRLGRALA